MCCHTVCSGYIKQPWEDIAFELEKTTYDVVEDNSHDYEVIAKVETNKIEPSPTGTYKRDENDLTDVVYATHENPYEGLLFCYT